MQKQMVNVVRELDILRKNQKEMLEIKNTVTQMKDTFGGLISRLDVSKERISKFEDKLVESFQIEMKRGKRMKKYNRIEIQGLLVTSKSSIHTTGIPGRRERERERMKQKKYLKESWSRVFKNQ